MIAQEKKQYILKNWRTSSGKRITEMLKRFWCVKENSTYKFAEKLFLENKTEQTII